MLGWLAELKWIIMTAKSQYLAIRFSEPYFLLNAHLEKNVIFSYSKKKIQVSFAFLNSFHEVRKIHTKLNSIRIESFEFLLYFSLILSVEYVSLAIVPTFQQSAVQISDETVEMSYALRAESILKLFFDVLILFYTPAGQKMSFWETCPNI